MRKAAAILLTAILILSISAGMSEEKEYIFTFKGLPWYTTTVGGFRACLENDASTWKELQYTRADGSLFWGFFAVPENGNIIFYERRSARTSPWAGVLREITTVPISADATYAGLKIKGLYPVFAADKDNYGHLISVTMRMERTDAGLMKDFAAAKECIQDIYGAPTAEESSLYLWNKPDTDTSYLALMIDTTSLYIILGDMDASLFLDSLK